MCIRDSLKPLFSPVEFKPPEELAGLGFPRTPSLVLADTETESDVTASLSLPRDFSGAEDLLVSFPCGPEERGGRIRETKLFAKVAAAWER